MSESSVFSSTSEYDLEYWNSKYYYVCVSYERVLRSRVTYCELIITRTYIGGLDSQLFRICVNIHKVTRTHTHTWFL